MYRNETKIDYRDPICGGGSAFCKHRKKAYCRDPICGGGTSLCKFVIVRKACKECTSTHERLYGGRFCIGSRFRLIFIDDRKRNSVRGVFIT